MSIAPRGAQLAFLSGQIGQDNTGVLVPGGCGPQTTQTLANIETILSSLGATPNDIVKLFTMVAGDDSFQEFAAARTEVFARWYPDRKYPAHSAAVVRELAAPALLVEIEAIVALPAAPGVT